MDKLVCAHTMTSAGLSTGIPGLTTENGARHCNQARMLKVLPGIVKWDCIFFCFQAEKETAGKSGPTNGPVMQ